MKKTNIIICLLSLTLPNLISLLIVYCKLIFSKKKIKIWKDINEGEVLFLLFFVLFETSIVLILGYDLFLLYKQILYISVNFLLYRLVARKMIEDERKLIIQWKRVSIIMSVYAIVTYIIGIRYGDRACVWYGEAGDLSLLLMPILGYYFYSLKFDRYFIVIFIAFILANSTASFLALLIFVSVKALYLKKLLAMKIFLLIISVVTLFLFFTMTVDDNSPFARTINSFQGVTTAIQNNEDRQNLVGESTGSVFVYLSNITVALNAPSRLFGTGLGTHENSYDLVFPSNTSNNEFFGLNKEDAYSLWIRIFSELGFVGLILYFFFLYKNVNLKSYTNMMAFAYIINATITGGNYAAYGQILFFIIFYQTRPEVKCLSSSNLGILKR